MKMRKVRQTFLFRSSVKQMTDNKEQTIPGGAHDHRPTCVAERIELSRMARIEPLINGTELIFQDPALIHARSRRSTTRLAINTRKLSSNDRQAATRPTWKSADVVALKRGKVETELPATFDLRLSNRFDSREQSSLRIMLCSAGVPTGEIPSWERGWAKDPGTKSSEIHEKLCGRKRAAGLRMKLKFFRYQSRDDFHGVCKRHEDDESFPRVHRSKIARG